MRRLLRRLTGLVMALTVDPRPTLRRWAGVPFFIAHLCRWPRRRDPGFPLRLRNLYMMSQDRFSAAGALPTHYFLQDLWAAAWLHRHGVSHHVDVGSRVDGFVAHVLAFSTVTFLDLRPLPVQVPGLEVQQGSVTAMPFASGSIPSLSSLSVIEHIGLGRYGDPLDPLGHQAALRELARVLAPGGHLLLSVPVGGQRLCFDAHRIFDPQTVVDCLPGLRLSEFSLIDDMGHAVIPDASFDQARACVFGCGLFVFTRPQASGAPPPG